MLPAATHTMSTKITLTRQPQVLTTVQDPSRRLDSKSASPAKVKSTIPMINYKSVSYLAEVLVNGHKMTVLVDTGSSDFWLSCAYASDFGCSKYCPTSSTYLLYGSGAVCVTPATGTLQVGDLVLKDYVVSVGQGSNMIPDTTASILSSGTQGLFGLAYASLAAIPNTKAGQFIDHLDSFSMYLTDAANSTGSFLMLNGIDADLVAKEKMQPFTVLVKENPTHWTIGMTAFQAGDDEVQFPCSSSSLMFADDPTRCDSIVDSGTSLLSMPDAIFNNFVKKYLKAQGCEDARDLVLGSTKELYFCESSVKLPRLGFTFDDYTFYITQKDYVTPVPETTMVLVELQSSGTSSNAWILGDTFLKLFYASYEVNKSITFYCRDADCAQKVVKNPVEPKTRTTSSNSTTVVPGVSGTGSSNSGGAASISDGGVVTTNASASDSSTVTILAVVLGLIGAVLLVGAFLFMRARKRRAAAARAASEAAVASPGPVVETPVAVTGAFYVAPAETPAESRV